MEPGVDGARKQIAEVVAERIERLILDGVLKAGQALPSERRLTEKLGVSRTALREGLRVLRARQIIHTAQGKGSYVAQISQVDAGPLVHLFTRSRARCTTCWRCARCSKANRPGWRRSAARTPTSS